MNLHIDCDRMFHSDIATSDHARRCITAMLETGLDGTPDTRLLEAALAQLIGRLAFERSSAEALRYLGGASRHLRQGGYFPM